MALTKTEIGEIKNLYNEAKNKKKEIGILSQLYACSMNEIREVLGMEQPGPKASGKERQNSGKTEAKTTEVPKTVPKVPKKEEIKMESPKVAPTRCQPGKAIDVWEETTDNILEDALNAMLKEFDNNEAKMKNIMNQMIPLAVRYKKYEAKQWRLAKFIEDYCRLSTDKDK